ncbi:hypothetical protein HDV00_001361 [Rhizophlyctis rosea]|nr:hypothetical protein HDV00_001361 [Rhizophlyctis rosea]
MDDEQTPNGSSSDAVHPSPSIRRSGRVPVKRKLYTEPNEDLSDSEAPESRKRPRGNKGKQKAPVDSETPEEEDAEQEEQREDEELSDGDESPAEEPESEADDDAKPKTPKGKPRGRPKKGTAKSQKKAPTKKKREGTSSNRENANPEGAESDAFSIFDIVLNHPNALDATVTDWLDSYREDSIDAMQNLVQLVVEASGCPGQVERSDFDDEEAIPEIVTKLEEFFDVETLQHEYPLIAKGKGRSPITKLRKHFTEFWTKWVHKLKNGLLYNVDDGCVEKLLAWLIPMSSSSFRALRHTSSAVGLIMQSALCDIAREVNNEWAIANRQLTTEQKKSGGRKSGANAKGQQLQATVEDLHSKKMVLERYMQDLFESFFVHRYRDTIPAVRMECVRSLGSWIVKFPEVYLDPQYLRYLGWMLSDKIPDVRQEALKSLSQLYATEILVSGLRAFTERFKGRLIDMALRDNTVRTEAVIAVRHVSDAGLLDEDDSRKLMRLMYDANDKVRELASPLVSQIWREEYLEKHQEKARAALGGANEDDVKVRWIELKAFCQVLIEQSAGLAEDGSPISAEQNGNGKTGGAAAASSGSQSQSQSTSASQSLVFGEDEFEENDEEKEEKRVQLADLHGWMQRLDAVSGDLLDQRVAVAVNALWEHMEFLHDWKSVCEYLAEDLTGDGETLSSSLGDLSQGGLNIYRLIEEEESCLLYVLSAVLERTLTETQSEDAGKGKKQAAGDQRVEIMSGLFKSLPKLFQKYGAEYEREGCRRIVQVVKMVRLLDLGLYLDLRMLKAHDALFEDLKRVFLKHADREVLTECTETFQFLTGSTKEEPKPTSASVETPKKPGRKKKASSTDSDDHDDASTASLHTSTKQKMEEFVDEVVTGQLANQLMVLNTAVEEGEGLEMELLVGVRNAAVRLDVLSRVVDVSETLGDGPIKIDDGTEWASVSELLNQVLDAVITLASKRVDTLVRKGGEGSQDSVTTSGGGVGEEATRVVDELLEAGLSGLATDALWETTRIYASLAGKKRDGAVDGEDVERDEEEDLGFGLSSEELKEKFQPYLAKSRRVIELAEAIIDVPEEGPQFSVSAKLIAMKAMLGQHTLADGLLYEILPNAPAPIDTSFQKDMIDLLMRVVDLCEFTASKNALGVSFKDLSEAQKEVARNFILQLFAGITDLVRQDRIDPSSVVALAQYYGVGSEVRDGGQMDHVALFGTAWDGIVETGLKYVVGTRVQVCLEDVEGVEEEKGNEGEMKRVVEGFRRACQGGCDVMFDCVKKSLDKYQSLTIPTINPTLSLAKLLLTLIKSWSTPASPALKHRSIAKILVASALSLLQRGAEDMVEAVAGWSATHGGKGKQQKQEAGDGDDDEEIGDLATLERGEGMKREGLEGVNEGWRVWGAIGGAVQQLLRGVQGRKGAGGGVEGIESVEDVVEHASQLLLSKGFKPVDTEKEWKGYWAFVKAIEKGDTVVRRRGGRPKKAESKKGGRGDATPLAASKKKRARSASRAKPEAEGDEETPKPKKTKTGKKRKGDDDTVRVKSVGPASTTSKRKRKMVDEDEEGGGRSGTSTPTRRSERTRGKLTRYAEGSEEEAEEEMVPVSRANKRVKVEDGKDGSSRAAKREEEEEEEGEEENDEDGVNDAASEYSEAGEENGGGDVEENGVEEEEEEEDGEEVPLKRRRKNDGV